MESPVNAPNLPDPISQCRHCHQEVMPFLDLGRMPLANGFLTSDQVPSEYFYPLCCGVCLSCGLVQLLLQPDPKTLFHAEYPFLTQSSKFMSAHFESLARSLLNTLPPQNAFVIEIGSNDGSLLRPFAEQKIRHLGIEPAAHPAEDAQRQGVKTLAAFFDTKTADRVLRSDGSADLILAANCFCHIADLNGLFENLRKLLKPDGRIIFEDPYFPEVLHKNSYDQIYDEHVFLFSLQSVQKIAAFHSLSLVDAEPLDTHGGSMRYTLMHASKTAPAHRLQSLLRSEGLLQLHTPAPYHAFARRVETSRQHLLTALGKLRSEGHLLCAYAATSKSTTVLNYCGIGPELIEFICDTTASKQGKLSPGMHIPVVPPQHFENPDFHYALLLGWNHQEEIMAKETSFRARGGRWITYIPEVRIL